MEINELSKILEEMISNAKKGNLYVQYHLFGIKYVNEILNSNYTIEEIVENAGIGKSLASEIRKGMKLSEFVELKRNEGKIMFEIEKQQIENYKKTKYFNIFLYTTIKVVSAYFLITYLSFGIFIVLAYIFYTLENITTHQFINSQESNLQINILYQNIEELKRGK